MRTISSLFVLVGLACAPLSAMAQDLAFASNAPVSDRLVFMGPSDVRVPPSAIETIRSAADAAKSTRCSSRAGPIGRVR